MSYPYILYKETEEGLTSETQFNLTLASIQGIYSAQLYLVAHCGRHLKNPKRRFQLLSKNPIVFPWENLTYQEAYLHPLNNLLDYQVILSKKLLYLDTLVKFDKDLNIIHTEILTTFSHIVRACGRRHEYLGHHIRITTTNVGEFMNGFVKYFELLYRYQSPDATIETYSFQVQEYRRDLSITSNYGYVKVGELMFHSTINSWLFSELPSDIKKEIVEYIPKTFSCVNKNYYAFTLEYILKYCKRDPVRVAREISRRVKNRYSVDRILEIYDPDAISKYPSIALSIIRRSFKANHPEILRRTLAALNLGEGILRTNSLKLDNIFTKVAARNNPTSINMLNDALAILLLHHNYAPNPYKLFPIINKYVMRLLLRLNKIEHQSLYYGDIYRMSEGAIDALIECRSYDIRTDNNALAYVIVDRILVYDMSLAIFEKLFTRAEFDPSFSDNILLKKILRSRNNHSSLVDIILNDNRTNIYLDNNLLPKLAASYPTQLLTRLQKDGSIHIIELMNEYVYPYLPKK
jgi:hypothetical protein